VNQRIIDIAVKKATKAALLGHPVARIIWIPPQGTTSDPDGMFVVVNPENLSVADTLPWD